jgi:crotonobetainyl-CoA:carnitine CoA-transferase CaiB-like acyl-CoA transferase
VKHVTRTSNGADSHRPGALSGVRVLDLGHFIAGPYAATILADLGADVIKIEDPDRMDDARSTGPHFQEGESVYYLSLNWGKRSLAVRMSSERGHALMLDLVRSADVILDNYKPGVMAKLGLDHERLAAVNPRVITCSLTGFGETGSLSGRPGYDYTVQALAGAMSLTGEPDGPPAKAGISYVDHSGGLTAALAICAALVERARTDQGRHIDLGLFDTQISMLTYLAGWTLNSAARLERTSHSAHHSMVPAQNFATGDGWISVFAGHDRNWQNLALALGDERLHDPAYASNEGRLAHRTEVIAAVAEDFAALTTEDAVERLVSHGVPCAPLNTVAQALSSPAVDERGLIQEINHPRYGQFRHVAGPVPALGGNTTTGAALLGEHSIEVLQDMGYDAAAIDELVSDGTVVSAHPASAPQ